jgi:hypothetical protein
VYRIKKLKKRPRPNKGLQSHNNNVFRYVGSEVLKAVAVKSSVSWDVTLCRPVKAQILDEHIASIFKVQK